MNPIETFLKDATKRDRLAVIMADPVLIEALYAIKYSLDAFPGEKTEGNPVIAASRFQQIAGINFLTRELERLTRDPITAPKPPKGKRLIDKLPDDPTEP